MHTVTFTEKKKSKRKVGNKLWYEQEEKIQENEMEAVFKL